MQIRTKLTLQFLLIGGIIMVAASWAIYISSAKFRQADFEARLENKARNTAKLLIKFDEIDANLLRKIERDDVGKLSNEKIIILNFNNDTLFSSDENGEIKLTADVFDRVRLDEKIYFRQGMYEIVGLLYTERYDRFVLIAAAKDIAGFSKLRNLRIILTVVCLVSILLFYLAGKFYAGRALKPISDVVERVEEISISSLNLRVFEGNGTDEIGRLAKTFNKMLERLEASFAMQKDFIANASHELRTPLTSINGQLEVLMMKDRTSDEYKSALTSVLDDIKSLIILSNRLLLIARARSENKVNNKVRIDEILWQVQEELKKFNNTFFVNINIDSSLVDSDQMLVSGDEYLIKTALLNIAENGCKYSHDNTVDINLKSSQGNINIFFRDRGIGVPAAEINKIFEPFYRGSNAKSIPGSGMGLPLVYQILKKHNGQIKFNSSPGYGTEVSVVFPSSS